MVQFIVLLLVAELQLVLLVLLEMVLLEAILLSPQAALQLLQMQLVAAVDKVIKVLDLMVDLVEAAQQV